MYNILFKKYYFKSNLYKNTYFPSSDKRLYPKWLKKWLSKSNMAAKHRRVHYKTDECQTRVRGQLHTHRIASKMAFLWSRDVYYKTDWCQTGNLGQHPKQDGVQDGCQTRFFYSKEVCSNLYCLLITLKWSNLLGKLMHFTNTSYTQIYTRFLVYLQFVIVNNRVVTLKGLTGRQNPCKFK